MYNGVINVYKEMGYTSHNVAAKMKSILRQKKTRHIGTLNPEATRVFPACLGQGTKPCDILTGKTKAYWTVILLGRETNIQDITGELLAKRAVEVTSKQVEEAVTGFVGDYAQIPPTYSALKVNGKELYELARASKEVGREARPVMTYSVVIDEIALPWVTMMANRSKGTYIRTPYHDIGRSFCYGGYMEKLLRTQVDRFLPKGSLILVQIGTPRDEERLSEVIMSAGEMFAACPAAQTEPEVDYLVHNRSQAKRGPLQLDMLEPGMQSDGQREQTFELRSTGAGAEQEGGGLSPVCTYDSEGQFIGVYRPQPEKDWYKPRKIFLGGQETG